MLCLPRPCFCSACPDPASDPSPNPSPNPLAPEVLSKQPQDEKVDVWALGCILYEMVTFSHAFSSTSAIQRGEFAPLPPDLPAELVQTITRLLQPNPADRPSVAELFDLPAVRCRVQEWPYPVMLDTPSPPPTPF